MPTPRKPNGLPVLIATHAATTIAARRGTTMIVTAAAMITIIAMMIVYAAKMTPSTSATTAWRVQEVDKAAIGGLTTPSMP